MNSTYLPERDADRVVWLTNFSNRLSQYTSTLGITAAEVTAMQNDAAMFAYVVQMNDAARQYASAMTNLKRSLRSSSQQLPAPTFPSLPGAGSPPRR